MSPNGVTHVAGPYIKPGDDSCYCGGRLLRSQMTDETLPSRIVRSIRLAENVDRLARLEAAPGEGRVGVEREVADRQRADAIENPSADAFHSSVRTTARGIGDVALPQP